MRFLSRNNEQTRGFTLVEMLVVAPLVILTIGGFIALLTVIVGDVLVTGDRNAMSYDIQDALDRIEQDTRLTTEFLTTTGTLTAPQGSDSNFTGTAAFTNTNYLLLSTFATDKVPTDTSRSLIYYVNQPNPCGATQGFNKIMENTVIYFIKSNSLWRRTIVPTYNLGPTVDANTVCLAPWQRDSCSPGYTAALCQTNDIEVMQNVSSLNVNYYLDPDDTTPLADSEAGNASAIEVTLNGSKTTAGRSFTASGVMRAAKFN